MVLEAVEEILDVLMGQLVLLGNMDVVGELLDGLGANFEEVQAKESFEVDGCDFGSDGND